MSTYDGSRSYTSHQRAMCLRVFFLYEICFLVCLMMLFCQLEWCGDCECWIEKDVEAEYYPSIYMAKTKQKPKQTSIRIGSLWAVIWIQDLPNSRIANHNSVNKDCRAQNCWVWFLTIFPFLFWLITISWMNEIQPVISYYKNLKNWRCVSVGSNFL